MRYECFMRFLQALSLSQSSQGTIEHLGKFGLFPVASPVANDSRDFNSSTVAIFTPVLFRDDLTSMTPISVVGRRNFLRYFIG